MYRLQNWVLQLSVDTELRGECLSEYTRRLVYHGTRKVHLLAPVTQPINVAVLHLVFFTCHCAFRSNGTAFAEVVCLSTTMQTTLGFFGVLQRQPIPCFVCGIRPVVSGVFTYYNLELVQELHSSVIERACALDTRSSDPFWWLYCCCTCTGARLCCSTGTGLGLGFVYTRLLGTRHWPSRTRACTRTGIRCCTGTRFRYCRLDWAKVPIVQCRYVILGDFKSCSQKMDRLRSNVSFRRPKAISSTRPTKLIV